MKKLISSVFLFIFCVSYTFAQLKVIDNSFQKSNDYIEAEWPNMDADGNENPQQILLRVIYVQYPQSSVKQLNFNTTPTIPNAIKELKNDKEINESLLFLPIKTSVVSISHPEYGRVSVKLPDNLKNKDIYKVELTLDKKVNIDIEPYTDNNKGITVLLDNFQSKTTPARFYDISVGKHKLEFNIDNKHISRIIDVSPQNYIFTGENPDFDLRTKKNILIKTKKSGAKVYVDGIVSDEKTPVSIVIPYGIHTIKTVYDNKAYDIKTVEINDMTPAVIEMHPKEKEKFKIIGKYNGNIIVGDLYVDGEPAYKYTVDGQEGKQQEFSFEMPIGTNHSYKMTYRGNEGNVKLKVRKDMPKNNYIEVKDRKKFIWPWDKPYEASPISFSFGYVQKQMVSKFKTASEHQVYKEDGVWSDSEGHYLHGLQVGLQYQPAFWWGLGIHTGLFYEFYWSKNPNESNDYYDEENDIFYYTHPKYDEHSLYIPAHLFYRIPFADKFSISFGGGLGLSYVLKGRYYGHKGVFAGMDGEYEQLDSFHGNESYPQRFNLTADAFLRIRLGAFMLCGQLGWGLIDHKSYNFVKDKNPGFSTRTVINHNSLTLSYLF